MRWRRVALNVGLELDRRGVLAHYRVRVLGTTLEAIAVTEDRERFATLLRAAGEPTLPSRACTSLEATLAAARELGYPLVCRAAYALGGLGSGVVGDEASLRALATRALALSPQVLIERSVAGWKELEYEVLRDAYDNAVSVCNMENIDPMGVVRCDDRVRDEPGSSARRGIVGDSHLTLGSLSISTLATLSLSRPRRRSTMPTTLACARVRCASLGSSASWASATCSSPSIRARAPSSSSR